MHLRIPETVLRTLWDALPKKEDPPPHDAKQAVARQDQAPQPSDHVLTVVEAGACSRRLY